MEPYQGVSECILLPSSSSFLTVQFTTPRAWFMHTEAEGLAPSNRSLSDVLSGIQRAGGPSVAVGDDSPLGPILRELETLAATETPAVFWGEPGSGRRTLARTLHALSRRREGPFVSYRSWTSAAAEVRSGLHSGSGWNASVLAEAERGTLLVEDLGGLPAVDQAEIVAHLDRVHMQDRVEGMGGGARVLAVASERPRSLVVDGDLSEELYHRLSVFVIKVPPLRTRPSDIVAVSRHVVRRANEIHRLAVRGFAEETLTHLQTAAWPGNVPELRKVVEHAAIRAGSGLICPDHLPGKRDGPNSASPPAHLVLPVGITAADAERRLVLATLEQTGFNKSEAARQLGMDVKTVRNKLKLYGLPDQTRRRRDKSTSPGHNRH